MSHSASVVSFCHRLQLARPHSARRGWVLPEYAPMIFAPQNRRLCLILFSIVGSMTTVVQAAVDSFGVSKKMNFLQSSAATPTSQSILGDATGSFHFSADLVGSNLNQLSPVPKLTLPNTTQYSLAGTGTTMGLSLTYTGKSALDLAFPNGNYVFTVGALTLPLSLGSSDTYPTDIPQITTGTWDTQSRLVLNAAAGATLNFNLFSNYANGAGGIVTFTLYSVSGNAVSTQLDRKESLALTAYPPLDPILSSYVITPGQLQADRTYYAELSFARIVQLNTSFLPSVGVATFLKTTGFMISTASPIALPAFSVQPLSQTATVGNNITLTAAVTGNPTPTLQWRKDGLNINGATLTTYSFTNAQLADAGSYTVVASNSAGNATSNVAVLSVNAAGVPVAFTTQPVSQTVTVGGAVTFTGSASGAPAPIFQWKLNASDISGATNSSYTIANTMAVHAGSYTVVATNASGTVTSNPASLTVNKAAAAVTLGNLNATYDGSPHAATASTTPTSLTVDFTYNGSPTAPTNAGSYAVVATINDANYLGSTSGVLVIAKLPSVITWAVPTTIPFGMALSGTQLNATANIAGEFIYSPASGTVLAVGTPTLNATFSPTDNTNYTSATAQQTLTISAAALVPTFTTQPQSQPAFVGATVTLAATVNGIPAPTYQWQKSGVNLSGETGSALTLANVPLTAAGSYALLATNSVGTVASRFARLVVLVPQTNAISYATTVSSTSVTAGGAVNLAYFMTNVGTSAWGANHFLSIRDTNGTFVAFSSLIGTLPGEATTAVLNFPAPATPGTYAYYVQALENGVEFFSTQTTFTLTVLAPLANSITYNTTTFPVSAAPGSSVVFTYNVTNTGTQSWGASHLLSLKNGASTTLSSTPLTVLTPGASKTVNLSFTAPTTPGTYNYTVQASQTGVGNFNTQSDLTLVVLAPRPNAIVYTATRLPDEVVPGADLNLNYSLSNAGTQAWGSSHYVSLRDENGAFLAFIPLSGIATGGTAKVAFSFSAPSTPGLHTYYVQALEDGIEFFSTQDVVVVQGDALPLRNAITYNATTFPATVAPGATVSFTYNITNRGTKTWGATDYLSFRDVDNTFLGFPSISGVVPGASKTVTISFTAPSMPGIYTYKAQGLEDGVAFYAMDDTLVLFVQ